MSDLFCLTDKQMQRIHTRYDRCAHAFMSAIALAASIIFWINQ